VLICLALLATGPIRAPAAPARQRRLARGDDPGTPDPGPPAGGTERPGARVLFPGALRPPHRLGDRCTLLWVAWGTIQAADLVRAFGIQCSVRGTGALRWHGHAWARRHRYRSVPV